MFNNLLKNKNKQGGFQFCDHDLAIIEKGSYIDFSNDINYYRVYQCTICGKKIKEENFHRSYGWQYNARDSNLCKSK